MKKYISAALLFAAIVFSFDSCQREDSQDVVETGLETAVTFEASIGGDVEATRTALSFKFTPSWDNTPAGNIHLFETSPSGSTVEGENVSMIIDESNPEIAFFKAEFGAPKYAPASKAGDFYSYSGIIAPVDAEGNYFIPAGQYPFTKAGAGNPESASNLDPGADFLVARSTAEYPGSMTGAKVSLSFERPVSVTRLAIMNVEGERIDKVVIESEDFITGSVKYSDIDFAGNFSFSTDLASKASKTITLIYDSKTNPLKISAEGTMYAWLTLIPGSHVIKSITVYTDKYSYTKTGGKTMNFKKGEFKQIAVDMSRVEAVEIENGEKAASPVVKRFANSFTLSSETEGAAIYYTIDGSEPTVESRLYIGSVPYTEDITVKAIAVANGYRNSDPTVEELVFFSDNFAWDLSTDSYSGSAPTRVDWVFRGNVLTLDKALSSTAANAYLGGNGNTVTRAYKGQVLTFSPLAGLQTGYVEFTMDRNDDVTNFAGFPFVNATAVANGKVVTVTPDDDLQDFSVTIDKAVWFKSVRVYYKGDLAPAPKFVVGVAGNIVGGSVSADPSGEVEEGTMVSVSATPDEGYLFGQWQVVDAKNNAVPVINGAFTMPASNVSVGALFNKIHSITITNPEHATITTGVSSAIAGTEVTLSIELEDGCILKSWVVTDADNKTVAVEEGAFIMPDSDVTVTADCEYNQVDKIEGEWTLVTDPGDVTAGQYIIAWLPGGSDTYYYLPTALSASGNPSLASGIYASESGMMLTSADSELSAMVWTFEESGTGFTISSDSRYLGATGDAAQGIRVFDNPSTPNVWSAAKLEPYGLVLRSNASSDRCLAGFIGTSGSDWRYYKPGSSYSGSLRLYKNIEGLTPQPKPATAKVTTATVSDLTTTCVTLNASYASETGEIKSVGFEYGLSGDALINDVVAVANGKQFSATLSSLEEKTTYYYRAYVVEFNAKTGSDEKRYSELTSFRTLSSSTDPVTEAPGYLAMYEVPEVTTLSGEITTGYYASCSDNWTCYKTTSPTIQIATHTFVHPDTDEVLRNYTVCYDESKYAPVWTASVMHRQAYADKNIGRKGSWQNDPAINLTQQTGLNNAGTVGYSRGHFVASSDRQTTLHQNYQTFYYTNQAPQWQDSFNSGIWSSLESAVQNASPSGRDTLYVVNGVLYEGTVSNDEVISSTIPTKPSGNLNVPIPSHFYKLVMLCSFDENGQMTAARGSAYIYTNEAHSGSNYAAAKYVTSIDAVEARTGFNFFPRVPEALQATAEASTTPIL